MSTNYKKLTNYKLKNKVEPEIEEILEENEIFRTISEVIIKYRKNTGLTQKEFAKKVDIHQSMVSKIESGKYNPSFKEIYRISRRARNSTEIFKKILKEILENLEELEETIEYWNKTALD